MGHPSYNSEKHTECACISCRKMQWQAGGGCSELFLPDLPPDASNVGAVANARLLLGGYGLCCDTAEQGLLLQQLLAPG